MGRLMGTRDSREAGKKQVSLTVAPQDPGGRDIVVEVKRTISAKKRRTHRLITYLLFAVMLLRVVPMVRDFAAYHRMNEEYKALQQYNQELITLQQQLEEERESLYSLETVEKLAREELDMVKPGESKVYQAIPTHDMPGQE